MRKIFEIIKDCKDGKKPTVDEMRLAICALDALMFFDSKALQSLYKSEVENKRQILIYSGKWQYEEHHQRISKAMQKTPLEFLGEDDNPDRLEVQERRKVSQKIYNNFLAKD
jgi:hypothetical protein